MGNSFSDVLLRATQGQSGNTQQHLQHRYKTRKEIINWPAAQARKEWARFDGEVNQVLENVLARELN